VPSTSSATAKDPTMPQTLLIHQTLSEKPVTVPIRRSSRVSQPPKWLQDFACNNITMESSTREINYPLFKPEDFQDLKHEYKVSLFNVLSIPEPTSYNQAKDKPRWVEAMDKEVAALEANDTWELTNLLKGKKEISSKWIFKIKFRPDGTIERYKARFVVRGFHQVKDKDYKHTFSPVAKLSTVRILVALATQKKWPLHQLDINNAFLHGFLDEEVYIMPPEGYSQAAGKGCKLKRSLYGLKQASRQWNKEFTKFFGAAGLPTVQKRLLPIHSRQGYFIYCIISVCRRCDYHWKRH